MTTTNPPLTDTEIERILADAEAMLPVEDIDLDELLDTDSIEHIRVVNIIKNYEAALRPAVAIPLLCELLVLRGIVRDLATYDPVETYRGLWVTGCPHCDGEPVGHPYPQELEHAEQCPYRRAVDYVSPRDVPLEGA